MHDDSTYLGLVCGERTKDCASGLLARRAVAQVLHDRFALHLNFDSTTETGSGSLGHGGDWWQARREMNRDEARRIGNGGLLVQVKVGIDLLG